MEENYPVIPGMFWGKHLESGVWLARVWTWRVQFNRPFQVYAAFGRCRFRLGWGR